MATNKQYEAVEKRILEALEKGTVPWRKPWRATGGDGLPFNAVSRKAYRGVNPFLLLMAAEARGFSDPRWLTYRQAETKGGRVRKGEKGETVFFWKFWEEDLVNKDTGETILEARKRPPMLRLYTVFNVEQTEGIEWAALPQPGAFDAVEAAERLLAGMPNRPRVEWGGDVASYSAMLDRVRMPEREAFETPSGYYSTFFHELGHSTGHPSRLKRFDEDLITPPFGSEDYSFEELVAELTAAFLNAATGIEGHEPQNAAYIANWLSALRNDPGMVTKAAAKAQKAADYIKGETTLHPEPEDTPEVVKQAEAIVKAAKREEEVPVTQQPQQPSLF